MAIRWPWAKTRRRAYTEDILAAVFQAATQRTADAGKSAAVEAAAGWLSRTLSAAEVEGPGWARDYAKPCFLAQVGRDLIRHGQSLHSIETDGLAPIASWDWRGGSSNPRSWEARVTDYGPHTSRTRILPFDGLVWLWWGRHLSTPSYGSGPLQFASAAGKLAANIEAALADEAGGPRGNLITQPEGASGDDAMEPLREAIAELRGGTAFVETTRGVDNALGGIPARDWQPQRLGAETPQAVVELGRDAYRRALAAMGTPAALFDDADGTSQREAMRRYFLSVVVPVAKRIEAELADKLEADISLRFDPYYTDMTGRAQTLEKLTGAGVELAEARRVVGL